MRELQRRRDRQLIFWAFWVGLWSLPMVVFLLAAVAQWTGWDSARDSKVAAGGVIVAVLTGTLMAVGGYRALHLYRSGLWAPPPARNSRRARLPGTSSSAKTPMARLDRAEARLDDLLRQLDESEVPGDWVDRARHAADVAAQELRTISIKLESVEHAMITAPAAERMALRRGVNQLRERLDEGLDGYGRLIAAAGEALLASAAIKSAGELTDATDHLAGLGEALREVSGHDG
jgi:hypothetical protein